MLPMCEKNVVARCCAIICRGISDARSALIFHFSHLEGRGDFNFFSCSIFAGVNRRNLNLRG